MFVKVAIDLALDRLFTYEVPVELSGEIKVGQLLRVPFGYREARGFALELFASDSSTPDFKIKPILGIADPAPFFSPEMLKLVRWISEYTCSPIETCLKAAVPAAVLKPNAKPKQLLYVEAVSEDRQDGFSLTAYQSQLLSNIRRVGGGWMQQICREFSTTPATLRAIEAKGAVSIEARRQRRDPLAGRNVLPSKPLRLNPLQKNALDRIVCGKGFAGGKKAPGIDMQGETPVLLHGVTGSGKTEVYLQAIAHELSCGRGAIVLVPEISLTPQTVRRFAGRFGNKIAVLHSA
ncbi:MAG: DEAD/DEAH box helicase family protein, partial [Kiritimatiellae bacterium]|nr:DEAD/DEAH box helicase family protein [Kiritimatiellia bacterium]